MRCPGFGHTVREPQVALEAVARASPPLSTVTLGVKVSLNRPGRRGDEGGEQRAGVPGCRSTPRGPRSGSSLLQGPPARQGPRFLQCARPGSPPRAGAVLVVEEAP